MSDDFEDHCWKDVIPADGLKVHGQYRRLVFVGPPAPTIRCWRKVK